jgi:hypothetical protein
MPPHSFGADHWVKEDCCGISLRPCGAGLRVARPPPSVARKGAGRVSVLLLTAQEIRRLVACGAKTISRLPGRIVAILRNCSVRLLPDYALKKLGQIELSWASLIPFAYDASGEAGEQCERRRFPLRGAAEHLQLPSATGVAPSGKGVPLATVLVERAVAALAKEGRCALKLCPPKNAGQMEWRRVAGRSMGKRLVNHPFGGRQSTRCWKGEGATT